MAQWLRLHASTAGGAGSIAGGGTKIPRAKPYGKKKKSISNKAAVGGIIF